MMNFDSKLVFAYITSTFDYHTIEKKYAVILKCFTGEKIKYNII